MCKNPPNPKIKAPRPAAPKRVKQSPIPLTPRAAAPAAACVAGRSTGQYMLPQPPSEQTATAPRPLCVVPKLRACETIPQTKTSSCRLSRACERIPLRHRSNLQRKKQHRHSGIFRVADLGPGTMPRGKYPESPAPAGSHALISRTPTPGGMLHANLGLPRPPPRNFQPPLPRFPSRLSPRRMSGTTLGRILSHPLPWSSPLSCKSCQHKWQQRQNHRHSGISAARRACLPIGVPGDCFTSCEADAIRAANPGPFPDSAGEIRRSRDLDWAE